MKKVTGDKVFILFCPFLINDILAQIIVGGTKVGWAVVSETQHRILHIIFFLGFGLGYLYCVFFNKKKIIGTHIIDKIIFFFLWITSFIFYLNSDRINLPLIISHLMFIIFTFIIIKDIDLSD